MTLKPCTAPWIGNHSFRSANYWFWSFQTWQSTISRCCTPRSTPKWWSVWIVRSSTQRTHLCCCSHGLSKPCTRCWRASFVNKGEKWPLCKQTRANWKLWESILHFCKRTRTKFWWGSVRRSACKTSQSRSTLLRWSLKYRITLRLIPVWACYSSSKTLITTSKKRSSRYCTRSWTCYNTARLSLFSLQHRWSKTLSTFSRKESRVDFLTAKFYFISSLMKLFGLWLTQCLSKSKASSLKQLKYKWCLNY